MEGKKQKHNKYDCHIDHIPLDLTMEILTRLPVKSLLKFQFVSKTWCSIIRSKDFIKSSVSMSSMPSSRLLISFRNGHLTNKNAEKFLFFFTSPQEQEHESSSLVSTLNMRMASMDAYIYPRCASVNGFICLSHEGRFMICNPSTRQVITLPELKGTNFKYLGYDPVDDQYKAMCKRVSIFEEDQGHMVLTLGGDKKPSWRRIEGPTSDYYPLTKGICINGFVYYGASTPRPAMHKVIVCFDVKSERLSFIKVPPSSDSKIDWESTKYLINYRGKLAYVNVDDGTFSGFDLWVLQDAKKHQWLEKSRIYQDYFGKFPMSIQGTNKIGEIIITPKFLPSGLQPFNIIYYNVESDKVREVQLEGVADDEDFRLCYGIGKNGTVKPL